MNKYLLSGAAVLVILLTSALAVSAGDGREVDEEAITRLEDRFAEAWTKRDLQFVEEYFSHDPELIWFFERRQLKGFEDVRKLYDRMFKAATNVKRTLSNRIVRVYGDAGFSSANFRVEAIEAGRRVIDEGRISTFYARQNGQWVAVHRHTSFQAPPGKQRRITLSTSLADSPAAKNRAAVKRRID